MNIQNWSMCKNCLRETCSGECLAEFGEWLDTMLSAEPTRNRIKMLLQDAYWKAQLDETELRRIFINYMYGIQLMPELSDVGNRQSRKRN